jgi:protein-S-isoprenylcysteine O-methyltransferase Ste14
MSLKRSKLARWCAHGEIWVIAQMLAMLAVLVLAPFSAGHDPRVPHRPLGFGLLGLSAVIAIAGTVHLGRNLSPRPKPHPRSTLVRHGIYGWVRHPLYLSLMLAALGWALLWQSLVALAAALVLTLVLDAKSRVEERWLRRQFPAYDEYARAVRRFVPWIY